MSDEQVARTSLRRIFDAAIDSAAPGPVTLANLPEKPAGRCVVIGAGKAAAAMAAAIDSAWPDVRLSGIVSTRYGHAVPAGRVKVIEAGHPVPDSASEEAARRVLDSLQGLTRDDLVIALISGGGSATLALPVQALDLAEKQRLTRELLASGATIGDINTVRVHLSQVKGGKLAAAALPAKLVTLLISDVPGDDPASVASGPTIPGRSRPADALAVLDRYGIAVSPAVRRHLETTTPHSPTLYGEYRIIASASLALDAAAGVARDLGFSTAILGDRIEGESRRLGHEMAASGYKVRTNGDPASPPAVLLSGGETTVTIGDGGAGRGGRNMEFLLSLAIELDGEQRTWALAGDSDGIDGTEDAAGAIITPDTLQRAAAAGIDPQTSLDGHDSFTLFEAIGDLVHTGPTLTNVNDIRVIMIC
jgi:hydroxypyruvate reductase